MNRRLKPWVVAAGMIFLVGAALAGVVTTVQTPSGSPFTLLWGQDSATGSKIQASLQVNPLDASLVPVDPCQGGTKTSTPILYTAPGSTTLVAGSAGKKIYICSVFMFTSAANNIAIVEGTGANCATGTVGVFGGATTVNGGNFVGNQGFSHGNGSNWIASTSTLGDDLCTITSATAIVWGVLTTAKQ